MSKKIMKLTLHINSNIDRVYVKIIYFIQYMFSRRFWLLEEKKTICE